GHHANSRNWEITPFCFAETTESQRPHLRRYFLLPFQITSDKLHLPPLKMISSASFEDGARSSKAICLLRAACSALMTSPPAGYPRRRWASTPAFGTPNAHPQDPSN